MKAILQATVAAVLSGVLVGVLLKRKVAALGFGTDGRPTTLP